MRIIPDAVKAAAADDRRIRFHRDMDAALVAAGVRPAPYTRKPITVADIQRKDIAEIRRGVIAAYRAAKGR